MIVQLSPHEPDELYVKLISMCCSKLAQDLFSTDSRAQSWRLVFDGVLVRLVYRRGDIVRTTQKCPHCGDAIIVKVNKVQF